ncbi:MAG: FAD-dependent oxidoreductase [Chloroflexi bacterium]|nr:FAD-dependent oxidoreductase [Chloroflexota bacterium]
MKEHARAVVIGGGIMGVSVAYHLAKLGWKDVVLVEKGEIASGESGWAAGLVTQFHTSPTLMQIRKYSIDLFSEFGMVKHVGSLRVASSQPQFKELLRNVSQARAIGLEVEVTSPDETVKRFPALSKESLYGAIFLPRDGHLDPYLTTTDLARRARELGVTVYTNTRVTGIELGPKGEVARVLTNKGALRTEVVVNAAGMWGPQVAAMAGLHIPTTPVDHQHITLKAVPGKEFPHDTPCVRDPDNLVYLREEAGGLVVGGYELNPSPRWIDGPPWDHGGATLPPDFDRFEPLLEGVIRRIPVLEKAEIKGLTCHPGAYTPDSRPMLGPMPGVRGYWCANGLSLQGYGGAGGMGKVLAEWIIEGEPSLDIFSFHAWRFGRYFADPWYAAERTREGVKYYYLLRYPYDENEWARPHRVSPLHYRMQEQGAAFGEKFGWERVNYCQPGKAWRRMGADQREWGWKRPPYFDRVAEEHRAVRERVGLFDMSSFGKIEVRGPGALPLLQRLTDSQMDVPEGRAVYTQFLNSRGGVEGDVTITRLGKELFRVVTGSGFIGNDLGHLRLGMRPGDPPVEIRDVTEDYAVIGMWGPKAREVLRAVTSSDVSNEALPYMRARTIDLRGAKVLAQRMTYVGELGWEFYVEAARAVQVWDALLAAGKSFGIEPGGYKVLDSLRLEKGYRYYSVDVTMLENPYEAGLGFCVRPGKGEFVGREALAKIKEQGLTQKLCTLAIGGEDYLTLYGGEAVLCGGKVVGRLRSAGYGFTLKKNIAYAYLPLALSAPGTALHVEIFGQHVAAQVAPDVLHDPKGERLHA